MNKSDLPKNWNGEYQYLFLGSGNTIIEQSPAAGEKIKDGGTVMIYLG